MTEMLAVAGVLLIPWLLMLLAVPYVAINAGRWFVHHGTALQHAIENYKVARDVQRGDNAGSV